MNKIKIIWLPILLLILSLIGCNTIKSKDAVSQASILQKYLCTGLSKSDIDTYTEVTPIEVKSEMNHEQLLYKYELIKSEDYVYQDEASNYDSLDITGMLDGNLSLVLLIRYNEANCLVNYDMYYIDSESTIFIIKDGEEPQKIY